MKNLTKMIAIVLLLCANQIVLAQPSQEKSFKKLDKLFQPYKYGKQKILLEPSSKDFIPIDHFKEYFKDKIGKLSYEGLIPDTIDIFGKLFPCVKQFTLTKVAPDPCEEDPFKVANIEPLVLFYNEIFPSFICGVTSNVPKSAGEFEKFFSDKSGSIGFRFSSKCTNQKINYEISSEDGYFRNVLKGVFYTSSGSVEIFPDIPWDYTKLLCNQQRTPGTITFRFYDEQGQELNKSVTVYYRSPNDCILSANLNQMGYSFSSALNMKWMPVAYVNEESHGIQILMNEITKANPQIGAWGFAAGEGDDLQVQVQAVWNFLQSKGMKYSSITDTPDGHNSNLMTQNIRNIETSLEGGVANCIDGTVLFASILRRWGFPCYIVLVPGHAFVAYDIKYSDTENGKPIEALKRIHLETTLMGSKDKSGGNISYIKAINIGEYEAGEFNKSQIKYYSLEDYRSFVKPIPFGSCTGGRN